MEEKLAFSNELSLRRRIQEIYERHKDAVIDIICKKTFVQDLVSTRNYLTHYDESLAEQAVSGDALYPLSEQARILIECCLLYELGLSENDLNPVIKRVINRRQLKEMVSH